MTALFLFGTLRHAPLLEIVAGGTVASQPARLPDHAVLAVRDQAFPMLQASAGARADGCLLADLPHEALARIDFYESVFGYTRHGVLVETDAGEVRAEVYLPPEGHWVPDGAWDYEDWAEAHGALNCEAARDLMARRGVTHPQELARLYPFIRARGWNRLRAARAPGPTTLRYRAEPGDVVVSRDETPFDGFFRFKDFDVAGRRFDGAMGPVLSRECFVGYDAALVLPYDPLRDRVMLVEQLRFGPLWRGDPQPWTFEPIAGMIDAGETAEQTARREATEETGLVLSELLPIAGAYPAPGYVTEFHHCFLGLAALAEDAAGVSGLASESENIRSHVISFDAAMDLVDSGEINVAPLIMMLLWLSRHRDRLRARHVAGQGAPT